MSHPLLMALFPDSRTAAAAARDVQLTGVAPEDLSVVASSHRREEEIAQQIGGSPGTEIEDSPAAGRLGELGGYILAAIAIGLPGTGAIVAAGPLAAELAEAAGHAAGDLKATLEKAGLSELEAGQWQSQIQAGAVLLGIHARRVKGADVESALERHSGGKVIRTQWKDN
jgi:microcystin degradation protein MlrC